MAFNWDHIDALAQSHQLERPSTSLESLERFLRWWWCTTYNRPFKDPLLAEYTLYELSYEYLRHFYSKPENDPKKAEEKRKEQEADDAWIKQQLTKPAPPKPEPPKEPEGPPDTSMKFEG
jgi:hypothetical protein